MMKTEYGSLMVHHFKMSSLVLVFSFYPFFERLASFATRWLFMPSVTLPKPCAGGGRLFRRTYFPINDTLCAPDLYI